MKNIYLSLSFASLALAGCAVDVGDSGEPEAVGAAQQAMPSAEACNGTISDQCSTEEVESIYTRRIACNLLAHECRDSGGGDPCPALSSACQFTQDQGICDILAGTCRGF